MSEANTTGTAQSTAPDGAGQQTASVDDLRAQLEAMTAEKEKVAARLSELNNENKSRREAAQKAEADAALLAKQKAEEEGRWKDVLEAERAEKAAALKRVQELSALEQKHNEASTAMQQRVDAQLAGLPDDVREGFSTQMTGKTPFEEASILDAAQMLAAAQSPAPAHPTTSGRPEPVQPATAGEGHSAMDLLRNPELRKKVGDDLRLRHQMK